MKRSLFVFFASLIVSPCWGQAARVGRPAPQEKIDAMNLTIFPSGAGLPAGSGSAEKGKSIFQEKCAVCHNDKGEGREGQYPPLVGGVGTINTPKPVKTPGSYWPYATTIFDYVRRAMPYDQPGTLNNNEVYSLVGWILNANGIIGEKDEMNKDTLPKVKMPNAGGFILDKRPDVKSKR